MKATVRVRNPFSAILLATVLGIFVFLVTSTLVMWGCMAIHDDVPQVPPIGFVASMWAVLLLEIAGTLWNLGSGKK